jgi:uncharacterized protein YeaO (DUF488 family)
MSAHHRITVSRVYDTDPGDGKRVLVDRLWPRGFRKGDPRIDRWIREVAPSTELRKWYAHQPERFDEFASRYAAELQTPEGAAALAELRELIRAGSVTLITAARNLDGSHVAVLAKLLT